MTAENDQNILHEADVEDSVIEELEKEDNVGYTNTYVANASVAHALNSTFSDTEVEAALNALGTKINAIFTILKNNGLMAES